MLNECVYFSSIIGVVVTAVAVPVVIASSVAGSTLVVAAVVAVDTRICT